MSELMENTQLSVYTYQNLTNAESLVYKWLKEEYIKGITGTSKFHVYIVTCSILASYLNLQIVVPFLRQRIKGFSELRDNVNNNAWLMVFNIILEHFLVIHPFSHVLIAENTLRVFLYYLMLPVAVMIISFLDGKGKVIVNPFTEVNPRRTYRMVFSRQRKTHIQLQKKKKEGEPGTQQETEKEETKRAMIPFFDYVTDFKSIISWLMAYSILAIDFPQYFPRSLCKTEEFGVSYADVGAASAVFCLGMCSRKIRDDFEEGFKHNVWNDFVKAMGNSVAVLFMGGLRFFVHYGLSYQEHVTEYGMHWNFYITISAVSLFLSFISEIKHSNLFALVSLVLYEFALNVFGLKEFILYGPRDSFVAANREGICSLIGYISITLIGISFGRLQFRDLYIMDLQEEPLYSKEEFDSRRKKREYSLLLKYMGYAALFLIAGNLSEITFDLPSRRFCNMSFVFWQIGLWISDIAILFFVDRLIIKNETSFVFETINYNSLFYFIWASMSCGFVNLVWRTLYIHYYHSYFLIFLYLFFVNFTFGLLYVYKVKL